MGPDTRTEEKAWVGKTLAEVCQELGNPDLIEPASYYSVKFLNANPSVVLTYRSLGHRWFMNDNAHVLSVIRIKE